MNCTHTAPWVLTCEMWHLHFLLDPTFSPVHNYRSRQEVGDSMPDWGEGEVQSSISFTLEVVLVVCCLLEEKDLVSKLG